MGTHSGGHRRKEDHDELARLVTDRQVEPEDGWPGEFPEEDRPTNENLWSRSEYYDQLDANKRNKIAATLAVVVALLITGISLSIGWMFGVGNASDVTKPARTATVENTITTTETHRVTLSGQKIVVTRTQIKNGDRTTTVESTATVSARAAAPVPGPTTRVTILKTIRPKPKVSIKISYRPGPTETITEQAPGDPQCYRVNRAGEMIEIGCP